MLLTKKSVRKIRIMGICYFLLGSIAVALWVAFNRMGIHDSFLLLLGVLVYLLGILIVFWGRYAEGKGKLISLGNRLVRRELKPAEFIKQYELLSTSEDLVLKKPSLEVLQLVAAAYDSLDNGQKALEAADEMMAVAGEKKKTFATLFKVSLLFSNGKTEEAEGLFHEIQKQKPDMMSAALADAILKSDRAMALGDYQTVVTYGLSLLERQFPKPDNLGKLAIHYRLGEAYERLNENENALRHYQYCADFGGETAMKASALEKLQRK